ncbi:MAG: response regulator, partial [Deltaproteobacteria bacterium]
DGAEALERIHSAAPPELVILDLALPKVNGAELIERIHEEPGIAQLPLIVLSGNPHAEAIARDLGADGVLQKPVTLDSLLGLVRLLLCLRGSLPAPAPALRAAG